MTAHVPPRCGMGDVMIWVLFSKPHTHPKSRVFKVSSRVKTLVSSGLQSHPDSASRWVPPENRGFNLHSSAPFLWWVTHSHSRVSSSSLPFGKWSWWGFEVQGQKSWCCDNSYDKVPAERRAAGTGFISSESRGLLQGDIFGRRKNLQSGKAKTSVTAEVCRYTQVRKSDPDLGTLCFF